METFEITKYSNGDILLAKVLIDWDNYEIIDRDDGYKFLKKVKNVNLKDLKKYIFNGSIIQMCNINNEKYEKLKYFPILIKIYEIIADGTHIIKNTKLNIKTIKKTDEGFTYIKNLGISVQCTDKNKCILEILHQCCENKIPLKMKVKLIDDMVINIQEKK